MPLKRRLTQRELNKLESFMERRDPEFSEPLQASLSSLHGFLTSVVSGPIIMPSEWIPVVFGDQKWRSLDECEQATNLLMRLYDEIASELAFDPGSYGILVDRFDDDGQNVDLADMWCDGYLLGIAMREEEWAEPISDSAVKHLFLPILSVARTEEIPAFDPLKNPKTYKELLTALPDCAVEIYNWWREKFAASPSYATVRRETPKVSPNAPCPCGSGKKFKRCCSGLRAV